jgi:hypothetical protein
MEQLESKWLEETNLSGKIRGREVAVLTSTPNFLSLKAKFKSRVRNHATVMHAFQMLFYDARHNQHSADRHI